MWVNVVKYFSCIVEVTAAAMQYAMRCSAEANKAVAVIVENKGGRRSGQAALERCAGSCSGRSEVIQANFRPSIVLSDICDAFLILFKSSRQYGGGVRCQISSVASTSVDGCKTEKGSSQRQRPGREEELLYLTKPDLNRQIDHEASGRGVQGSVNSTSRSHHARL